MSFKQTRFTIMALPQNVDANGVLSLNIVFIPRNINPLKEVNTKFTASQKATAFVNIQPNFDIKIVNNPNEFPGKIPGNETSVAPIAPFTYSAIQEKIYTVLRDAEDGNGNKKYFDIDDDKNPKGTGNSTLLTLSILSSSIKLSTLAATSTPSEEFIDSQIEFIKKLIFTKNRNVGGL